MSNDTTAMGNGQKLGIVFLLGVLIVSLFLNPLNSLAAGNLHYHKESDEGLFKTIFTLQSKGFSSYSLGFTNDQLMDLEKENPETEFFVVFYKGLNYLNYGLVLGVPSGADLYAEIINNQMYIRTTDGSNWERYFGNGSKASFETGVSYPYYDEFPTIYKVKSYEQMNAPITPPIDEAGGSENGGVTGANEPTKEEYDGWFSGVTGAISDGFNWVKENLNPIDWFVTLGNKLKEWFVPSPDYNGHELFIEELKSKFPHFFIMYDSFYQLKDKPFDETYRPQVEFMGVELIPYHILDFEFTAFFGIYKVIDFLHMIMITSFGFHLGGWIVNRLSPRMNVG